MTLSGISDAETAPNNMKSINNQLMIVDRVKKRRGGKMKGRSE